MIVPSVRDISIHDAHANVCACYESCAHLGSCSAGVQQRVECDARDCDWTYPMQVPFRVEIVVEMMFENTRFVYLKVDHLLYQAHL